MYVIQAAIFTAKNNIVLAGSRLFLVIYIGVSLNLAGMQTTKSEG